ncbi:hypothetical protein NYR68_08520 [Actinobacillus equuli subsp. haemolyticus]|uniref:hypothetical protein n=1 Tax=Actinobacillus equuli TaxID=718 RepID=UPI0024467C3B|nr:hypothetical protein [Actinobacillus equuli]WGE50308.1 hypothetical protein NYR68_08520 [Actinobacillus equuli subsp. haemolyticus]
MKYIGKIAVCLLITIILTLYENKINTIILSLQHIHISLDQEKSIIFKYVFINIITLILCDAIIWLMLKMEEFKVYLDSLFSKKNIKNKEEKYEDYKNKYLKLKEDFSKFKGEFKVFINHFLTILERNKLNINYKELIKHLNKISIHIDKHDYDILKERCESFNRFSTKEIKQTLTENNNSFKKENKQ